VPLVARPVVIPLPQFARRVGDHLSNLIDNSRSTSKAHLVKKALLDKPAVALFVRAWFNVGSVYPELNFHV
jgi:hypothetical protein